MWYLSSLDHYRCNGLTLDEYQCLQLNMEVWLCKKCISDIFPFTSLDEFEFDTLVHSERPSGIELLPPTPPPLDIMSKISGLNNIDNSGIESKYLILCIINHQIFRN